MIFVRRRSFVVAPILVFAIACVAQAQTDYFWQAPVGSTGNWDNSAFNWSDAVNGPQDYGWQSNGNERANFGGGTGATAGTVTLTAPITAYGVNFATANYVINGGGNALTLSGTGGVINSTVAATINAQISGNVGLSKTGSGALTLGTANTYSGGTSVAGGTLLGVAQASGSPFSSGPIALSGAILQLKAVTGSLTTTTNVGNLTISAANASTVGASQLSVDNTSAGGAATTTFAAGNLLHGGIGTALVVTPVGGSLGGADIVTVSNGNSLLTNGILPPWVVTSSGTTPADYVTYGGTGISIATYSGADLTTSNNTSVVSQTSSPTITGDVSAYALKDSAAVDLGSHTLNLGNGTGQSGLILNGGSITNGNISFGATEGVVFSQGTTTLGSNGNSISSNGLTITALGAGNTTINSNIVNGTSASQVTFTGITSGTSLTLNGANGYTGGTILSINTGTTGNVFVGNDSAFGTGKVTNILVPGTGSDQIQAAGGDRTLANPFDLNGGLTFTGTNSFAFTGPITIISASTGNRTLANNVTTAGKSVTFGSSGTPSTLTLGNPVSNGGDGVGRLAIFTPGGNATTIINDVIQDPAPGGGTASGSVRFNGTSTGATRLNGQNTYSGTTDLAGSSIVQIGASSIGSNPSILSGPFGVGTILANNGTNNPLRPVGGDATTGITRTIANPISMITGFLVSNDPNSPKDSLTFTGPIAMNSPTSGRTINNSFTAGTGGTLTLGDPNSPSTITGNTATAQLITIASTNTTIVNDAIQDAPGSGVLTPLTISGGGNATFNGVISVGGLVTISAGGGTSTAPTTTVTLNPANTYAGGTSLTGAFTILPITSSSVGSPGSVTSGPFGTGTISINNGSNQHIRSIGGDRTISNAITMITGFVMDNPTSGPDQFRNMTFAGPITMQVTQGRFISNGFSVSNAGGTMNIGDATTPSTVTLATIANATLDFAALSGPIVINDVIQDAPAVSGLVRFNTNTNDNSPITINSQNTFTGSATIGVSGFGNVQIGTSSVGDFGAITSGPFGVGALASSSTAATTPALVPFGADRTVSNGVTLNGNLAAANAGAETFNLNLTGPISLGATGRSIKNNMAGAFTLGQSTPAASLNGIVLSQTAGQILTFNGASTSTTVVNDVIQNGGGGIIPGNVTVAGSIVQFNNANTYGTTGTPGTTVSGGKLLVNNTSGSGTGAGDVTVSGGTLGGNGTISGSVSVTSGAIAPGNSAGTLNVSGNVSFGATGGFNVEIGGTTPGVGGYDQLVVSGSADLSGASISTALTASLLPGFSLPTSATDFTILTAAAGVNLGGGFGFGTVTFPDGSGRWTVNYNANSIVLHLAAGTSGIAGDYNHNGVVDMADYVLWRNTKGQTGSGLAADGNNDNVVNDADYSFWRARFGNTSGSGSGLGGNAAAVPEPGVLSLIVCAIGAMLCSAPRGNRR